MPAKQANEFATPPGAAVENAPAHGVADVVAKDDVLAAVQAPLAAVHHGEVALPGADFAMNAPGQLLAAVEHAHPQQVRHGQTNKARRERG